MLAFFSFLLVCIGAINWFCIGILQYDFVAGVFGSQSNIFSRLIYTLVGIASIVVVANLIKNKGKFIVSFKKAEKEYNKMKEEEKQEKQERQEKQEKQEKVAYAIESADENYIDDERYHQSNDYAQKHNTQSINKSDEKF